MLLKKMAARQVVNDLIAKNALVVFSKTTCPYCQMVYSILVSDIKAEARFVQLDKRKDGPLIQDVLQEMTGSRSVPKVFVRGSFIGTGDDTRALYENGKLVGILAKAGVKMAQESKL
ncbi:glutaredoxin-like isoform X2 [Varroa destructor]|uniref:Glutaredoxin domain-containing protein n=1 Tax=Varroa destructor TaxID=109461 RepID=A0A7M7JPJ0_VARDE|nr:glutaredoxin-like isoform X2 [Varroa destructor]XP_022650394.1 glutaredoxin-like isoform X2 [Varroa destructor]XP_022650395.1 glutaredoxin-like isoform X2 [Varroa destructor]